MLMLFCQFGHACGLLLLMMFSLHALGHDIFHLYTPIAFDNMGAALMTWGLGPLR